MTHAPRTALISALESEAAGARSLLDCLEHERAALLKNDADALQRAAQAKLYALSALETHGRRRGMLAAGPDAGDAESAAGWQRLLALAARCEERNRANAALLEVRRSQALSALHFLGVRTTVYARDGQAMPEPTKRVLARG